MSSIGVQNVIGVQNDTGHTNRHHVTACMTPRGDAMWEHAVEAEENERSKSGNFCYRRPHHKQVRLIRAQLHEFPNILQTIAHEGTLSVQGQIEGAQDTPADLGCSALPSLAEPGLLEAREACPPPGSPRRP